MTTRPGLTARFWLAAAAGCMLYLRPANLDFCSAYADGPASDTNLCLTASGTPTINDAKA